MPVGLRKWQAVLSLTTSPYTRDLRHLTPVPRWWAQRVMAKQPNIKAVRVQDRIKWWNIVPGDQVRVLGAKEAALREVSSINKLANRVLLKKENQTADEHNPEKSAGPKADSVHYSRCQLYVGMHKFPPAEGSTEPQNMRVFATRVDMSTPYWFKGRYNWERYAVNTSPRLPGWSPEAKEKILIPWPEKKTPPEPDPSAYDTERDAVLEITYQPPTLPSKERDELIVPSEQEYIRALKARSAFSPAAPIESYMEKELTNPHSRAKKQARWQAHKQYKESLREKLIRAECAKLQGRTKREAVAEAMWKWKNQLLEERRAELARREVVSGREGRREAKRARKAKKQERINEKLRHLVLDDAPNQVLPGRKRVAA